MIAANGVVAKYLEAKGFPSLRRVLRSPERWDRIIALAAGLGERLPPAASAPALEAFLNRRRRADPARFPDLSLSIVKLLGAGEYVLELPGKRTEGHFGLAVKDYTHSTAPNRRFPDLVTQRLVKAALAERPPPYDNGELAALARHCTEQENNAAKVERQVRKSAAALLLAPRHRRAVRRRSSPAPRRRGRGCRIARPASKARWCAGSRDSTSVSACACVLVRTEVERGFIDFERTTEAT